MNVDTLGALLRTLRSGAESTPGVSPTARVASITAALAIGARADETRESRLLRALAPVPGAALPNDPVAALAADETVASVQSGTAPPALPRDARVAANAPQAPVGNDPNQARPGSGVAALAVEPSASLKLSDAASFIGELLKSFPETKGAPTVHPAQPLVERPTVAPALLAQALRASIEQSGLFYESHLAQWTLQQFPEPALAREPQAQWSAAMAQDDTLASALTRDSDAAPVVPAGGAERAPALPLLRQQLNLLESGQLAWTGELWPGQPADIEIAPDEGSPQQGAPLAWRTRIALDLPALGHVELSLTLQGDAVRVDCRATDAASVSSLKAGKTALVDALQKRSLNVSALAIGHGRES